ncbi:hypothetical protein [uncultured Desulfobacter sp.]|uniref:hypothetical protein n=1 Tax=uncultured Desulfobacter sp. TaxID=240139 RepID=UPI0029F49847|nr:hypothetical protein [uncultured Desulfobacter sp.]
MKYTLTFNDGMAYTSPDIRRKDPGWASEAGARRVGIRELVLNIPGGKALVLEGFEAYNFFVEASQALGGSGANIEAFNFCGRWHGYVVTWRIDFKTGQITKLMSLDGLEYFGTATRGWREGLMGEKARSGVCPLQ